MTRSNTPYQGHELDRDYYERIHRIAVEGERSRQQAAPDPRFGAPAHPAAPGHANGGSAGFEPRPDFGGQNGSFPNGNYTNGTYQDGAYQGGGYPSPSFPAGGADPYPGHHAQPQGGHPQPDPGYFYPQGNDGQRREHGFPDADNFERRGAEPLGFDPAAFPLQRPQYDPARHAQSPGYAPEHGQPLGHDGYHAPQSTPHGYGQPAGYGQSSQHSQGYAPSHQAAHDLGLRGANFDDAWRTDASGRPSQHDGRQDPLGFDLTNYQHPGQQHDQGHTRGHGHDQGYENGHDYGQHPGQHPGQHHEPEFGQGYGQGYGERRFDDPFAQPGAAVQAHERQYAEDDEDDDLEEENDHSGSRRIVAIAAGLVLLVAVGGGALFGYSQLTKSGSKSAGSVPVVRSTSASKEAPESPGGTRFANTDSKLLGRLDAQRAAPADGSDRVRPVSTMVVRRDGSLVAEARPSTPDAPAQPQRVAVTSPIPGMTIVGVPSVTSAPPAAAAPAPRIPAVSNAAPVVTSSTTPPVVIANTAPAQVRSPPSTPAPVATESASTGGDVPLPSRNTAPRTASAEPRQEAVTGTVVASAASAAVSRPAVADADAGTSAAGSAGWVAVIALEKSRIDALKSFADMKQRFGGALDGAIPDIQQADLTSKGMGVMYRVVVGPPASRSAANDTCTKLRQAGHSGCWVKTY